ncbi:MAG: hypothetical protein AABY22_16395 [Nanoarchaeota archaeon]
MKTKFIVGLIATTIIIVCVSIFIPKFTPCFIMGFYGVFALGYFAARKFE